MNRFATVTSEYHQGPESLVEEMEVEYELTVLESGFRSALCDSGGSPSDKTVLAVLGAPPEVVRLLEAQGIVGTLDSRCTFWTNEKLKNKRLLVALLQRLLDDDRRLFQALCLQTGTAKERDLGVLCNILEVLLLSDTQLLSGKKGAARHSHDKRLNQNANWFLPFCDAFLEILQAFPGEESFQLQTCCLDYPPLFQTLAGQPVISCQRSVMYFRECWEDHITFCASLLCRVVSPKSSKAPPNWTALAIKLWHHLVVCLSHSETAKAILHGADQSFLYYQATDKAGIKEYLRPLLRLFKTLPTTPSSAIGGDKEDHCHSLSQCVYQVAGLLVAQSRYMEHTNRGMASFATTGETFTLHTAKLENAILSYCNKDQCHLWNVTFLPWAMAVVEEQAGQKNI